jgi:hypothetical protein
MPLQSQSDVRSTWQPPIRGRSITINRVSFGELFHLVSIQTALWRRPVPSANISCKHLLASQSEARLPWSLGGTGQDLCVRIHDVALPFTCVRVFRIRSKTISIISDRSFIVFVSRTHRRRDGGRSSCRDLLKRWEQVAVGVFFIPSRFHARAKGLPSIERPRVYLCLLNASRMIAHEHFLGSARFAPMYRLRRSARG